MEKPQIRNTTLQILGSKTRQYAQYAVVAASFGVLSVSMWSALKDPVIEKVQSSSLYKAFDKARTKEVVREVFIPEPKPEVDAEVGTVANYIKARNTRLPTEISDIIASIAVTTAKEYNIPVPLLIGIIEKESVFNPSAQTQIQGKSGEYAKGLMQVYQGEGVEVDQNQVYDLSYNMKIGCTILNKKLELNNGNIDNALRNYSGNAEGYSVDVLSNVGRYTLYKWKTSVKETTVAVR